MRKVINKIRSWQGGRNAPVRPSFQSEGDKTGTTLLIISAGLLTALAFTQGLVSYVAQYHFIYARKHDVFASTLEALGLDCAAVVLALLAIANARLGRKALAERLLSFGAVGASMIMNIAGSDGSNTSIMVYALPAVLYAVTADRLIAIVRHRYLAQAPTNLLQLASVGCNCAPDLETSVITAAQHLRDHLGREVSIGWLAGKFRMPRRAIEKLLDDAKIEAVA